MPNLNHYYLINGPNRECEESNEKQQFWKQDLPEYPWFLEKPIVCGEWITNQDMATHYNKSILAYPLPAGTEAIFEFEADGKQVSIFERDILPVLGITTL
jgi:hypothetical protein